MERGQCVVFKGDIKDVCAKLEAEAKRCKGMTLEKYIRVINLENAVSKQFGEKIKFF